MAKNYYLILGIASNATEDDIRTAYRRMAKAFHPDHYSGNIRSFLDAHEAYSVLSDAHKRKDYDRLLSARRRPLYPAASKYVTSEAPGRTPEPLIPDRRPAHPEDISLIRSFQTFTPDFDEIFSRLWSNLQHLRRSKAEGIQSLTIEIPLTFQQAQQGGQARILVPTKAYCPTCRGQGALGNYECPRCAGDGCLVGESPVNISFPPGLSEDDTVLVSLERFGIRNRYLTVNFRITSRV